MYKHEFLAGLRKGLSGLPQEDIEERLLFYSEMIDDRIEEGMEEECAVAEMGTVQDVISQIMSEIPLSKLVKEKVKPKKALSAWEIVLLILGFPLWFSLLAAAFAAVMAVYIAIWSVIISLWSVDLALAACLPGGILSGAVFLLQGNVWAGIAALGVGFICGGLSILFFFCCKQVARGFLMLTKKILNGIKSRLIRKGRKNE